MQNTKRLKTLIHFFFRLHYIVSENEYPSMPREREEIAGCIIGAVVCRAGEVGVDVQGDELADSPRDSFSREIIVTSKMVNHIVIYDT